MSKIENVARIENFDALRGVDGNLRLMMMILWNAFFYLNIVDCASFSVVWECFVNYAMGCSLALWGVL